MARVCRRGHSSWWSLTHAWCLRRFHTSPNILPELCVSAVMWNTLMERVQADPSTTRSTSAKCSKDQCKRDLEARYKSEKFEGARLIVECGCSQTMGNM